MKCEEDYKQTPLPGLKRYKLEKTVKSSFLRLYLPEMPSGAYMLLCRDHRHRQLGREAREAGRTLCKGGGGRRDVAVAAPNPF